MALDPVLEHPLLGKLRGCDSGHGTTIQYRGIQFATIEGRWKDPVLVNARLSNDERDCTKFGPECPQALGGLDFDLSLVGNVKLDAGTRSQSELECLHLVVTTPANTDVEISNLPVVVW
jgi:carboxylesterase type B